MWYSAWFHCRVADPESTAAEAAVVRILLDPATVIGRAPQQVERFLAEEVVPALRPYAGSAGGPSLLSV